MTVGDLYTALNQKIPPELSCDWDNDGLMCCADPTREVRRVLVALDITAAVVQKAIDGGYDTVISHHPLIFTPLRALNPFDPVAKKVIDLLQSGIAAMSFHTRLDAVEGGVNDVLATALDLEDVCPFGADGEEIGRIGSLKKGLTLSEFGLLVKRVTGAEQVLISDAGLPVRRVAVLGGSGASEIHAARAAGADTYLTGELKHNNLTDAPENGMNLVSGGHFYTEHLVCKRICELVARIDPSVYTEIVNSNPVRVV